MDDIIAERTLTFRAAGADSDETVTVRLGRPMVEEHAPLFTLRYEIAGPGDRLVQHYACGEDSMQALVLAFTAARAHLDLIGRSGKLEWLGAPSLGLPPA